MQWSKEGEEEEQKRLVIHNDAGTNATSAFHHVIPAHCAIQLWFISRMPGPNALARRDEMPQGRANNFQERYV